MMINMMNLSQMNQGSLYFVKSTRISPFAHNHCYVQSAIKHILMQSV